ncbi:tRNA (mnm(5)s(2)U34)-methyltransferase [Facklamia miroungae]|uniref:Putative rRNA methylase n=1 Tax=Facklamia miroungae TaxID=120956 RepID=A0A1G7UQI5_9LACT|nr:class I SAM-dependent methyltransferase [Facklamia miroungae]NKZ30162.1 16S rRNA (cytosine(1402)-N(4))-methyltransferase [Facklamia miroungae]SDG49756.1 Putative rRNA methylase [Facklamia miroungae]
MKNALQNSHDALAELIETFPEGIYIDATVGKGKDTRFIITQPFFKGKVYGFDIQRQAIELAQETLADLPREAFYLFNTGHERFDQVLSHKRVPQIHGAIFNLGYLPGTPHQVTTQAHSTIQAVEKIAKRLIAGGKIFIVVYSGHPEGAIEKEQLLKYLSTWPQEVFSISRLDFINQINHPPLLITIEKK